MEHDAPPPATYPFYYAHFRHPDGSFPLMPGTDFAGLEVLVKDFVAAPSIRDKSSLLGKLQAVLMRPSESQEEVARFLSLASYVISLAISVSVSHGVGTASRTGRAKPVVSRKGDAFCVWCWYSPSPVNPFFPYAYKDVEFEFVGTGETIRASRARLATATDYFEKLFSSDGQEPSSALLHMRRVQINEGETTPAALRLLLEFIATDPVPTEERHASLGEHLDQTLCLWKLSKRYRVKKLSALVQRRVKRQTSTLSLDDLFKLLAQHHEDDMMALHIEIIAMQLQIHNVLHFVKLAQDRLSHPAIADAAMRACKNFVFREAESFVRSLTENNFEWVSSTFDMVHRVLDFDMALSNEVLLFQALVCWHRHDRNSRTEEAKRLASSVIRIHLISGASLAAVVEPSGLLDIGVVHRAYKFAACHHIIFLDWERPQWPFPGPAVARFSGDQKNEAVFRCKYVAARQTAQLYWNRRHLRADIPPDQGVSFKLPQRAPNQFGRQQPLGKLAVCLVMQDRDTADYVPARSNKRTRGCESWTPLESLSEEDSTRKLHRVDTEQGDSDENSGPFTAKLITDSILGHNSRRAHRSFKSRRVYAEQGDSDPAFSD